MKSLAGIASLITKVAILIVACAMLSGCMADQCIDADDFGFPKFTVSARYNTSEIVGAQENEVAPWRNTTFTTNGQPLTILVKNWRHLSDNNDNATVSAWSPWYGSSVDGDTTGSSLSPINQRFITCTWSANIMDTNTRYAMITNAPCLLHQGTGLYALLSPPGVNPNAVVSGDAPQGITMHIGAINSSGNLLWQSPGVLPGQNQSGYHLFDVDSSGKSSPAGGLVYQYTGNDSSGAAVNPDTYNNAGLYFKILDKFYDDNSGQYRVVIKSGIKTPYPDPIQYITALVKYQFFGDPNDASNTTGVIKNIYLQVIQNSEYRTTVGALLMLYVMFTAFSFLIGTLEITHTELITRVLKIGIVAALLDPDYGWSFFYNYLFVFFIDGTTELINIIQAASNSGGGSDSLVSLLIAPETIAKVMSLLFTSSTGIIYIIIYVVLLVFYLVVAFRTGVLYITALLMIGMIIVMGPIFLCFMLFNFTKSLFENWLKQLMSYTLQPIILITSIAFMSMMIRHEIYATLGFKVCRINFPDLGPLFAIAKNPASLLNNAGAGATGGSGSPISLFFWYFPVPMIGTGFSNKLVTIPVPEAHAQLEPLGTEPSGACAAYGCPGGVPNGTICKAYGCFEPRYIDLPFLDPNNPRDMTRRNNFLAGNFAQFESLIYIIILIYLLNKFNDTAVGISQALNNTSANSTNTQGASEAAAQGITDPIKYKAQEVAHKVTAPARAALKQVAFEIENKTVGRAARAWETFREKGTAEEALGTGLRGAKKSILDRVKANHGLDKKDIDPKARKTYQDALAAKLQEATKDAQGNETITKADAARRVKNALILGNKHGHESWEQNYSDDAIKNLFAEAKFGDPSSNTVKTFDKLTQSEKDAVNLDVKALLSDKSFAELAEKARQTQDFQKAYVEEYKAMSKEGSGFIGKRSSIVRGLSDFKKAVNKPSSGAFSDAAQAHRGDLISSGYDSLKHALSGGLLEGDSMQYNYDNKRMQTYQEELSERSKIMRQKDLKKEINIATSMQGRDILRPEYLGSLAATAPDLYKKYQKLAAEQIKNDVYGKLTQYEQGSEHEPALMGDKYMKEKMTDTQFRTAIDRAYKLKEEFVKEDKYLKYAKDYADKTEFNNRKATIDAEFIKHIESMNQYRKTAGMAEYRMPPPTRR